MPSNHNPHFQCRVDETPANRRLDTFLAKKFNHPRNQIIHQIKQGLITVDGRPVKPAHKVSTGEMITGLLPAEQALTIPAPETGPLDILFVDDHLIVLSKPAGMVVHPAPGHYRGTLVNALLDRFPEIQSVGDGSRPGIVHRLDRDTSGVLVVGRTDADHEKLTAMFAERQVEKQYLAIVYGKPASSTGTIHHPIGRHPVHRKKMSVSGLNPRPAESHWQLLRSFSDAALLRVKIKTGRTHQIRVHCAAVGLPVVGDPIYRARWTARPVHFQNRKMFDRLQTVSRQMLHAWKLRFSHPATGQPLRFIAPPPADFKSLRRDLRRLDLHSRA